MSAPPELKATLTLPETKFPMKANLPQNEPARLKQWKETDLYGQIRRAREGSLKSTSCTMALPTPTAPSTSATRSKVPQGLHRQVQDHGRLRRPLRPRLGLPRPSHRDQGRREARPQKARNARVSVLRACREYAQKYHRPAASQLIRLGVFGQWDNPYLTMSKQYEASTLETFYDFFEKGFVYKGLKPVYWCMHDRTALAEAEIEYEMHTSPSVYVRYALTSDPAAIDPALAGKKVCVHHLDHHAMDASRIAGRSLPS